MKSNFFQKVNYLLVIYIYLDKNNVYVGLFSIIEFNGDLIIIIIIDRENIQCKDIQCILIFDVVVTLLNFLIFEIIIVNVYVIDINDNVLEFLKFLIIVNISEIFSVGYFV